MCGIIAYTGHRQAQAVLLDGLRRLEYRGYDSAGISIHSRKKNRIVKCAGKIGALESKLDKAVKGHAGIGHTRWATHGAPSDENAHPHCDPTERISLVHNGIIENLDALSSPLIAAGVKFQSETDSEVLAHLIAQHEGPFIDAVRAVLQQVVGTYGLAVMDKQAPETIVVARNGSPVILGIGSNENFAASDMSALSRYTREVIHLDDGEVAEISPQGIKVTTLDASPAFKEPMTLTHQTEEYDRGEHDSFLYKEISEQAETITRTLSGRLDDRFATAHLGGLNLSARDLLGIKRITILGCGSALYAGMAGASMIEQLARIPVSVEAAAEFRYRNPVIEKDTIYIVVSQSGETFDTLAALREVQRKGGFVLGIINSVGSTIAREVDGGIYMHAGPEVSVASTKAYSSMLVVFALLATLLGRSRDLSPQKGAQLLNALRSLPELINKTLKGEEKIKSIALEYAKSQSAFFIGRTYGYPIALEGAQKLKEISYIHAEAYPASELKHGPLALVTSKTPCVVVLPDDALLNKSISSLEEIKARSGPVITLTNAKSKRIDTLSTQVIRVPAVSSEIENEIVQAVVMGVALQLLAYHSAKALGRNVDQPRNLAKSVTVE